MKKTTILILSIFFLNLIPFQTIKAETTAENKDYIEGEVIVKFKENQVNLAELKDPAAKKILSNSEKEILNYDSETVIPEENIFLFKDENQSTQEIINQLEDNNLIEYAEPNYIRTLSDAPNDLFFEVQWALNNTGQIVNTVTGTVDADIDWLEASESLPEGKVIVAILDSGINYNHEDLQDNLLWDGSAECYNENNVLIEGGCPNHGWDFRNSDNDPIDDHGHGTFIAGVIGATPNNEIGIAGVSPNATIMAVKFVGDQRTGTLADLLKAMQFAINNGAQIINASYGGNTPSQAEKDLIDNFEGLVIAAAGNGNDQGTPINLDEIPTYPASYDSDNIITVAATDQNDELASFSNYGVNTVDLSAPGVNIASTCGCPGDNDNYVYGNGTSYSAPFVTASAATLMTAFPDASLEEIKNSLIYTGDQLAELDGITLSGNRLNLNNALTTGIDLAQSTLSGQITGAEQSTDGSGNITISFQLKDTLYRKAVTLSNFAYSLDNGENYTGLDMGIEAFSDNADSNNYISDQGDNFETTYTFQLDSKNELLELTDTEQFIIRFQANHDLSDGPQLLTSEAFTLDRTGPETSITIDNPPSNTTSRSINLTLSSEDEDITQFQYTLTGLNDEELSAQQAIDTPIELSNLSTGTKTLQVYGQDEFGNSQAEPTIATWTINRSSGGGGGGGGGGGASNSDTKKTEPTTEEDPLSDEDITRTLFTQFTDTQNHWAKDYITELQSLQIVSGKTETEFGPNDNLTRAEITKIALLTFKYPIQTELQSLLTDIKTTDWFYAYITTANQNKIANGYADLTFKPNNSVNRAEALKIILTASKLDISKIENIQNPFTDVKAGDWFAPYVQYAFDKKIVSGKTTSEFDPTAPITRAEMAKIAVETLKLVK